MREGIVVKDIEGMLVKECWSNNAGQTMLVKECWSDNESVGPNGPTLHLAVCTMLFHPPVSGQYSS